MLEGVGEAFLDRLTKFLHAVLPPLPFMTDDGKSSRRSFPRWFWAVLGALPSGRAAASSTPSLPLLKPSTDKNLLFLPLVFSSIFVGDGPRRGLLLSDSPLFTATRRAARPHASVSEEPTSSFPGFSYAPFDCRYPPYREGFRISKISLQHREKRI